MRKRARAFVATIQCIFCYVAFAITKFSFYSALFKRILACEGFIFKRYFLEQNCSSPCNISYDIQLIQCSGGSTYVTHKDILPFQVASGRFLLVVGRFLLVVGRFGSFLARYRSFQVVSGRFRLFCVSVSPLLIHD